MSVTLGVEKATKIAKCDGCGSNLAFSPEKQCLCCPHCGSTAQIQVKGKAINLEIGKLKETSNWQNETQVYTCNNCGASSVLPKNEIATSCPFCGTPNVVKSKELSGLKPNAIVPFKIGLEETSEIARKWLRKRFFAPRAFKKSATPEEIKGIYNPVFSFNANTDSSYRGVLIKYHIETRIVDGQRRVTRREERFEISGTLKKNFTDILIQASSKVNQNTINKISPFGTESSLEYTNEYLYGFTASLHTKDGENCWGEAKSVIDRMIRSEILSKYPGCTCQTLNVKTSIDKPSFKYNLLPIYVGHSNWKEKLYNFYVNGINGKMSGQTPISGWKVFFTVIFPSILVVAGIIAYYALSH